MMKRGMRILTACILLMAMLFQAAPALMDQYVSSPIIGGLQGYKEALEILNTTGTYLLVGNATKLTVNEDYQVTWESSNSGVISVSADGAIVAMGPGEATVKATTLDNKYSATELFTVISPSVPAGTAEGEENQPAEESGTPAAEAPAAETPAETPQEQSGQTEGEQPAEQPAEEGQPEGSEPAAAPAKKEKIDLLIVVNGLTGRLYYNGEEQSYGEIAMNSNNMTVFDPEKVVITGPIGVTAKDCGTYIFKLDASQFSYDDEDVRATFVVNNGFLKILPAPLTLTVANAQKAWNEPDPEFTVTADGLLGEDKLEDLNYVLTREPGEDPGVRIIMLDGEPTLGNYRVQYKSGILTIGEKPAADTTQMSIYITSSWPEGQPGYVGAQITLTAHLTGFEGKEYTLQWQYSDDLQNWKDIPGENGETYTYSLNEETTRYQWRVVAADIQ